MHLTLLKRSILATAAVLAVLAATVAASLWQVDTAGWSNTVPYAAGQASSGTFLIDQAGTDTLVLGSVAPFTLIDDRGRPTGRDDLLGNVWVAGFIYTRCAGPCLRIVGQMQLLDKRLPSEVRLVCFSADPEFDTPKVLQRYRTLLKIDSDRWLFLTGEREPLYRLIRGSFHLGVQPAAPKQARPGEQVTHSTRLVLVDRDGQIRGYFDGEDPEEVERLAHTVRTLAEQRR